MEIEECSRLDAQIQEWIAKHSNSRFSPTRPNTWNSIYHWLHWIICNCIQRQKKKPLGVLPLSRRLSRKKRCRVAKACRFANRSNFGQNRRFFSVHWKGSPVMSVIVNKNLCKKCGACSDRCLLDCLRSDKEGVPFTQYNTCWYCGAPLSINCRKRRLIFREYSFTIRAPHGSSFSI